MIQATTKPKRSVSLNEAEINKINNLISEKGILEVSFSLRVARDTLTRVLQFGSGAEKTILKIRQNLPS